MDQGVARLDESDEVDIAQVKADELDKGDVANVGLDGPNESVIGIDEADEANVAQDKVVDGDVDYGKGGGDDLGLNGTDDSDFVESKCEEDPFDPPFSNFVNNDYEDDEELGTHCGSNDEAGR